MAKLLKPLVVIVLLVAIAAVVIQGVVLFPKRTLIKERTQKLEGGLEQVVTTLKNGLDEDVRGTVKFKKANLSVDSMENIAAIDKEINNADAAAKAVLEGWENTKTELETTRQDLENTRAELQRTQNELDNAKNEIVQLHETIQAKDAEIAEQKSQIASLEEEKSSLEIQVDDLNAQIASLQDQIATLEEEKAMLESQLAKCDAEINAGNTNMKLGTKGKLVYVNPEWNFGVIDIGLADGSQAGGEMMVRRGDELLGRIRISAVKDSISIVEILPEYQEQAIKEGDDVLF